MIHPHRAPLFHFGHGGRRLRIAVTAVLAVAAGAWIYQAERAGVREAAASTFGVRADLVREYIGLMRHKVYSLEDDIESRHADRRANGRSDPRLEAIRRFRGYNVWGIGGQNGDGPAPSLGGSLTGSSVLADPPAPLRTELATILDVDSQFMTLLRHVSEIASVRYTSRSEFIHVAPDPGVSRFRFSRDVYERPSWTGTVPWHNTERRQVISRLYDNPIGNGRIISIASPVEFVGRFKGVVSVDLDIERLRDFLALGDAAGESILVDEDNRIVARAGDFDPGETYEPVTTGGWNMLDDGAYWMGEAVVARELRLLHRLPESAVAAAAVERSVLAWLILAAAVVMVFISIRLNDALGQVRDLMNRDTLTYLLNRRGFEAESKRLRESLEHDRDMRASLQLGHHRTALILFDVDHFKQINDTHGHELGDEVLSSLARRLTAGLNENDLVCRWGGEEILVMLVAERTEYFLPIAERLREAVASRPLTHEDIHITISGGLVEWGRDESLEDALRRADRLLYEAKHAGRNRVETDIET